MKNAIPAPHQRHSRKSLLSSLAALFVSYQKLPTIMAFAFLGAGPLLGAQDAPLITITKSDKISIALNAISGKDGAGISQVLQKDLQLSGAFSISNTPSANFLVSGSTTGVQTRGLLTERGGKVILERTYSGPARSQAHAFANDIIEAVTGTKGVAGSRIGFVANRSGSKEIYLVDSDGGNLMQLTHDSVISVSPRFSSGARRIAYTGYQSGYADVYEIELGSGRRSKIMRYPGTNSGAAYSPDGSRFAVTLSKDGNPELYVTDSGGGSPRRLTITPGVESSPTWSPDGRELIYSSDSGGSPMLYRISSSGGLPSAVRTGHSYNTEPNWSPDGKRVAFNVREGGTFQIAVLDLGSGHVHLVGEGQSPAWGPNSRHLVYAQGGSLVLLDTLTMQRNAIAGGLGRISEPTWAR